VKDYGQIKGGGGEKGITKKRKFLETSTGRKRPVFGKIERKKETEERVGHVPCTGLALRPGLPQW